MVEVISARKLSEGHELRTLVNGRSYLPQFVFLNSKGEKVLENNGFNTEGEARAMHAFVSSRAYERVSFREFVAVYKE